MAHAQVKYPKWNVLASNRCFLLSRKFSKPGIACGPLQMLQLILGNHGLPALLLAPPNDFQMVEDSSDQQQA